MTHEELPPPRAPVEEGWNWRLSDDALRRLKRLVVFLVVVALTHDWS